jgi:hypothetical protein
MESVMSRQRQATLINVPQSSSPLYQMSVPSPKGNGRQARNGELASPGKEEKDEER